MGVVNKVAMIFPYFGHWPEWIDLFFYSCSKNSFIDFYFITDCKIPSVTYKNTFFLERTWKQHCEEISNRLGIEFNHPNPYKLCDLRPSYAIIYDDIIGGYDYWGYGDIDLCYGDLSKTSYYKAIGKKDLITTHANRVAGHFTLVRNCEKYNNAFRTFREWKKRVCEEKVYGFDEYDFTEYFIPRINWLHRLHRYLGKPFGIEHYSFFNIVMPVVTAFSKLYLKEGNTSPAPKEGEEWSYDLNTGCMLAPGDKELPYLHFLFFKKTPFYETENYWKEDFWKVPTIDFRKAEGKIVFSNKNVRYIPLNK